MKPAPIEYVRADSAARAVEALADHGEDARILAGGQSLIPMLSMRITQPRLLIDITRIDGAGRIELDRDRLVMQVAATQSDLLAYPGLAERVPLLAKALPYVGHFQTRNRGTVCGSIAHGDPSSELPLCLAVLDGTVTLLRWSQGKVEWRDVAGSAFFTGTLETARLPTEMIANVHMPLAKPGEGYAFNEMSPRHGDFAIVAVAVKATADGIRIGIGGAPDKPHVRDWPAIDDSALDDALNALAWELDLQDDAHASAKYRRHLVRTLGRRTIAEARACLT